MFYSFVVIEVKGVWLGRFVVFVFCVFFICRFLLISFFDIYTLLWLLLLFFFAIGCWVRVFVLLFSRGSVLEVE